MENRTYSMDYAEGVVYGVPKQSMPGLLEFSLDFYSRDIYCSIDREDARVEITWSDKNGFYASAISKADGMVTGSTSELKEKDLTDMKKLGDELGISEKEMSRIIQKGNELYKDFYPKE